MVANKAELLDACIVAFKALDKMPTHTREQWWAWHKLSMVTDTYCLECYNRLTKAAVKARKCSHCEAAVEPISPKPRIE